MSGDQPIGPDHRRISAISGRRQAPALRAVILVAGSLALLGLGLDGAGMAGAATISALAVGMVAATPLLRVGWLIFRWSQEGDRRFVAVGVGLLAVVAMGATLSVFGLGR